VTHNGASIVGAGDVPPAVHAVIDGHPTLGVDGTNLAIGALLNLSAAPGGMGRCAFGLMVARGLIPSAIAALGSAPACLGSAPTGLGSSSTGLGSSPIRALRSSSSVAARLARAVAG